MNKCNCHSYNIDTGKDDEVILIDRYGKKVCIDNCIAGVIKHLWENGIETLGSCCGHGKAKPSIILQQNTDKFGADIVRKLISRVDDREFKLESWILTTI